MMENGRKTKSPATESTFGETERNMLENSRMVCKMEKESCFLQQIKSSNKDIGRRTLLLDSEDLGNSSDSIKTREKNIEKNS